MSSSAGNSKANLSQPSSNGEAPIKKLKVIVQPDGSVVGENSKSWNTRTGDFVRAYIPVHFLDIRRVPKNFKDDVWKALMGEFELNVPEEKARPLIEKSWSQKFRSHKYALRTCLRKNVEPKGVDPDIWKKFLENESDPKKQQLNAKNAENRSKLEFSHTLGRRTYAQKQFLLEKDEPGKLVGRVDMWLVGHQHSNGTVLESAKSKYDEVKAIVDANKRTRSESCSDTFVDIDNDELSEIFGKDKKGRVRGIGSHISKKQLLHTGVAKALLEQYVKANAETTTFKDELSQVNTRLDDVTNLIQAMYNKLSNGKESSPPVLTPQSELGSISTNRPNLAQNLDNIFASLGKDKPTDTENAPNIVSQPPSKATYPNNVPVIICDKFGKDLAKGYIVSDATAGLCHGRRVSNSEKKVYVENVLDPEARLWDAPQDGHETLAGYVGGGFLIWLKCWLKNA